MFHTPRTVEPARVLFLNDTSRNGGPGRSLRSFLQHLDPARVHRAVLLPRPGEIADALRASGAADEILFEPAWVEHLLEPWGRSIQREDLKARWPLKSVRFAASLARMATAFSRVATRIVRSRTELIYCNGTTADFMGAMLGILTRRPVVWHARYTSVPAAAGRLHAALAASPWVRRIVCVSRPTAAQFAHVAHKTCVWHNGVDLSEFQPGAADAAVRARWGIPADAVVFGSHGRVLRRKGYVEMLNAAAEALSQLNASERSRCRFVIVGDTPQDFRPDHLDQCRALAETLGIARQVTFTGFQADVRPLVRAFDVAVVPSVYPDPLPRAVIESMALGKPVIAFDVGGVREMLTSREGGLVPGTPPNLAEMARQFVQFFRDGDLRRRAGLAARRRVETQFDVRHHARQIEGLILDIVGRPQQVPSLAELGVA
jgi:glycosyltransferase involved in cell wall biosynthesis